MHFARGRLRPLTIAALVLVFVPACSAATDPTDAERASRPGFPRTVENCGRTTTVDHPPGRVVSLNQGSTEILLSLGLADRVVGTATWTDPVRSDLAADNARVPRLSDNQPSLETVLNTEPELVTASFGGTLGPGGVATRERLEQLGVSTYLSPSDCDGKTADSVNADGARTEPFTMDLIHREIRELAEMFDVSERGDDLIARLRAREEQAAATRSSGVTMAFWFADTRTPYMAGCCGSSGVIASAVGATNVFADTKDEWPQVSWETVADRDPTVLVLADLSRRSIDGDALASKIAFLESNPVTREMRAVRDKRYVVVNGADLNPSIRTVDGIEKTAAALRQWHLVS
ncbi:ABC transporter substrate-binding protein [Gordonia sp. CPCC 206044]|uniref:ABC transporter substrate-binding protein n=1 Tax=Gordonia sp. CPCC 206044 TaxID=3140793 RepID=UPI003AF384C8